MNVFPGWVNLSASTPIEEAHGNASTLLKLLPLKGAMKLCSSFVAPEPE